MQQTLENLKDTRHPRLVKLLAIIIGALGIALRIRQFAVNRSLWFDEASLALNIVNRSPFELLHQLDYSHGDLPPFCAPIGFLLTQKLFITLLGNTDTVLRLLPLTASIAAVPLMCKLLRAYTSPPDRRIGLLALWLFAVSQSLIWYGSEAKQYSSDVLAALTLVVLAHACLTRQAAPRHLFYLGIAGILSLLISYPSLFVIVGVTIGLASAEFAKKDWGALRRVGAMGFAQAVSFIILYLLVLRPLASNKILIDYWRGSFMPLPPWREVAWFPRFFSGMLIDPLGLPFPSISAVVILIGGISLILRNWQFALCLMLPFLAALAASGFEKYPMSDRLLLFVVPIAYLALAEGVMGVHWLLSHWFHRCRWVSVSVVCLLVGMLLYSPTVLAFRMALDPDRGEDIKPVMSYVKQRWSEGDFLYVYYGAAPAFRYYAPFYGIAKSAVVIGVTGRNERARYIRDIERVRHHKRVWFLFSHTCTWCVVDEESFYLGHLEQVGRRMDEFHAAGASVYLYEFDDRG
jgi:hypothetical protein